MLRSINPATEKIIKEYPEMNSKQVSEIIKYTDASFHLWKKTSFNERSELMINAANILRGNKNDLGKIITLEMGKPIAQSIAEVEKCGWVCDYYAENAERFLTDELIKTEASKSFVAFQPIGVVLAVMPWNFPFWQVFRFAAPALMAGNAGILKHASNVSGCALEIEKVFIDAGFPENIFRTILVKSSNMDEVIRHPLIRAVTLTGSVFAGKAVASRSGSLLKKTVLELGGSDPYVVLEDADLEKAADVCVTAKMINGGQSCIAAKRFIIVKEVYEKFVELFLAKLKNVIMGDPFDENNSLGPQASVSLRNELHQQVQESLAKGAKLLLGGKIPDMPGAYYPVTVLSNVKKGMPAYEDELFGPVASIIKVKSAEEALNVANDTVFGLGAAVFTKDKVRGENIAKSELLAGACFVNAFVKSDPRLPFGGVKESGYGRELSSFGIREFVNIKTVLVE
ncbi:MAG: NAD-dependent succinate-semialdehyde dehydrogenase [Ignavibacteria bacterium]|jgi:succinate-semialdehyde dehydrogenase/glutarate-semialdehyde dehydrogenase